MRLYAQAQAELYGNLVEVYDDAFICHKPVSKDGGIYIQLLYVDGDKRSTGIAKQIMLDLCKKYDAKYLTGFIDLNTDNYKETLIKHLKCGYDIIDANRDSLIVSITKETLENG